MSALMDSTDWTTTFESAKRPDRVWRQRVKGWNGGRCVVLAVAFGAHAVLATVNVVTDFGARTDGTLQSETFQKAIDAAAAKGGDTVVVPPGEYLVAGIFLKDNVTLRLEEGATLVASTNLSDYATFRTRMPGRTTGVSSRTPRTSSRCVLMPYGVHVTSVQ